ncbi:hypothetical protein HDE_04260 [Halotydeus destructor]|nr:hypothetical protein HDE_04260 [Halotydeus destructor]
MASKQLHDLFRIAVRLIDAGKEGRLTDEEETRLKVAVVEASRGDQMCKSEVEETLLRYLASHLFPGIESLIAKSSLFGLSKSRRYNSTVCGLMTLFCYQIQEGVSGIHREFTKPHVNSEYLRQAFTSADHGCKVASAIMEVVLPGSPIVPGSLFFSPGPGLCNVKRWLVLTFPQLALDKADFTLLNDLILFDTYDPHMWGSKVWPLLHFLATLGTMNFELGDPGNVIDLLERKSKKSSLSLKTRQTYLEWLRPYSTYCQDLGLEVSERDSAIAYLSRFSKRNRNYLYALNVCLLLQKLYMYNPPIPRPRKDEFDDALMKTENELCFTVSEVYHLRTCRPFEAIGITEENVRELIVHKEAWIRGKGGMRRKIMFPNTEEAGTVLEVLKQKQFTQTARTYRNQFHSLQREMLLFEDPVRGLHALRRAAAMAVYGKTDLNVAKTFLGHASSAMTERYLRVHGKDMSNALTRTFSFNPLEAFQG